MPSLLLLDGGIGHLLKQRGVVTSVADDPQWRDSFLVSALANEEAPYAVRQVHSDYIAAGCDVITCNNFSCTPWSLSRLDRPSVFRKLTQDAGEAARAAADKAEGAAPLVAGCLPPLTESYAVGTAALWDDAATTYSDVVEALQGNVDVLLCETMVSIQQALIAVQSGSAEQLPIWVSFTLEDSTTGVLRGGECAVSAAVQLAGQPHVEAILFNCCAPQAISAVLPKVRQALEEAGCPETRLGAYANGFYGTTSEWLSQANACGDSPPMLRRNEGDYAVVASDDSASQGAVVKTLTPGAYSKFAVEWFASGASIIGGCCGIGPQHMAAVRAALPT